MITLMHNGKIMDGQTKSEKIQKSKLIFHRKVRVEKEKDRKMKEGVVSQT